jgi:hypothetical protein
MTPLDAMYAASMVTFAPRSFEGKKLIRDALADLLGWLRRQEIQLRLNEGAANDSFFS